LTCCHARSLGQNFCTDDGILQNIVRAAGVKANDLVIEVGPGTGNLTRHLAATGAQLVAVEKDDTLFERLQQEFAEVCGRMGGGMHCVHQVESWCP
jgi:16S rRNA (adenine1518-N6/adenine1519-N6)-dimethyltransferase